MMRRLLGGILAFLAMMLLAAGYAGATILVYDGGGSQSQVQAALTSLGYTFDLRTAANPVTAADLATHDMLVIGWNYLGDMSGLPEPVLAAGITGNILLTGHDADLHAVWGYDGAPYDPTDAVGQAAIKFLTQAIAWAGSGAGTGLVAFGDYSSAFAYLPDAWGISATGGLVSETVTAITGDGTASGVYDGLTPGDLSNWGQSYHARFTAWGTGFVPFELGGATGADYVTIAYANPVPEPGTLLLLGSGLAGLAGLGRKKLLRK